MRSFSTSHLIHPNIFMSYLVKDLKEKKIQTYLKCFRCAKRLVSFLGNWSLKSAKGIILKPSEISRIALKIEVGWPRSWSGKPRPSLYVIQQAPRVSYVQVSQTLFGPRCPLTYVRKKSHYFKSIKMNLIVTFKWLHHFLEKGFIAMTIICFLQEFECKLHLFYEFLIYAWMTWLHWGNGFGVFCVGQGAMRRPKEWELVQGTGEC